jgi:hypothetical protein
MDNVQINKIQQLKLMFLLVNIHLLLHDYHVAYKPA